MSSYSTLFELGKALLAETDISKLLPLAMDKVIEQTQAERGMIVVYGENGELLFETARELDKKDIENPEFQVSKTIMQQVRESGEYKVIKNALTESELKGIASILRLRLLSVACAPLRDDSGVFGIIYIDNRKREARFNNSTGKLLAEFADLISVAVKNALLFRRQVERERKLEADAAQKDLKLRRQIERRRQLEEKLAKSEGYDEIKGLKSMAMLEVCNQIEKVGGTDSAVLIIGETGTGKDLVAQTLHRKSKRRQESFVALNCAALPDETLFSELFGHKKGSFTGALEDKMGYFETADGGTIFLDEIAKSSRQFQAKLLRVLETGEFNRLGDTKTRKTDVRIISAAGPNLPEQMKKGEFYPDLYYRLESFVMHLPPLHERREDILEIAKHFLKKFAAEHKSPASDFSAEAGELLLSYRWPGNVRELKNAVNRAVILAEGAVIDSDELPITDHEAPDSSSVKNPGWNFKRAKLNAIEAFERQFFHNLLQHTHGHITKAAQLAGMYNKNLIEKMHQYNLQREDYV